MSACGWVKLEADGRVLRCDPDSHGPGVSDAVHASGDPFAVWTESDPCAWDARCLACSGDGVECIDDDGRESRCPSCGGSGTVEDVPLRLIDVGSVLREGEWREAVEYLVVKAERDGWFAVDLVHWDLDRYVDHGELVPGGWQLVRAVPPSSERPLTPNRRTDR